MMKMTSQYYEYKILKLNVILLLLMLPSQVVQIVVNIIKTLISSMNMTDKSINKVGAVGIIIVTIIIIEAAKLRQWRDFIITILVIIMDRDISQEEALVDMIIESIVGCIKVVKVIDHL